MARLLLQDALLLDPEADAPERGSLLLEAGRIAARLPPGDPAPPSARVVPWNGDGLAPGFLDLHFHGRLVFAPPQRFEAELEQVSDELLRQGTTGFLATTVAWPAAELGQRAERWAEASAGSERCLGLHLEGPWIHPEAAGAQPGPGIRPYDAAEGAALFDRCGDQLRLVTLAPEVEGAAALQAELARRGVVAALGHSLAEEAELDAGLDRGLRHVTHLFNAMGGFHHRRAGVARRALADDALSCDLICDGIHVHPEAVRIAARAKGERLLLITDRVEPPADGAGFGSGAVHDDGSALRLADGTLVGSSLGMDRACRNAQAFGAMTQLEAVAASSLRPARLLGLGDRGHLRRGARADLVRLDPEGRVLETWIRGERAFGAS